MTAVIATTAAMAQKKPEMPKALPANPKMMGLSVAEEMVMPMVAIPMKAPLVRGNHDDPRSPTPMVA